MQDERRFYPRYGIDLGIELLTKEEEILEVEGINLSCNGMQIRCDEYTAQKIHLPGITQVDIRCFMPIRKSIELFEAHARVIFVYRLSQHAYHIGLQFISYQGNSKYLLHQYITILALSKS